MKYTVYKTTNLINGKIYIGIHGTKNINDSYIGSGRVFLKAVKLYGKSNFKKEILYVYDNKHDALKKELELVNEDFIKKDTNYNCTIGGYGGIGKSQKGYKHTKEAIEKIRKAGKRKCKESTKNKISLANKGFKHTEQTIEKNRKARLEYYKKNKSHRLGVSLSEDVKKKMSESKKGIKMNEETKLKISLANKGKNKKGKKIINKETKEIYESVQQAIKKLNIPSRTFYRKIKDENYFLKYE